MDELIDSALTDLALFARVVDAGGFTAASRVTKMPQPTISRRITQLEARIGLRLLDRTTRAVSVTEAGRRVYDHAVMMIAAGEAAATAAVAMRTEISGLVRISAPVVLGQAFVAPVIKEVMSLQPNLRLDVEWTTRRVDLLHDDVDIALGIGRPTGTDQILIRLGHAKRRVYAPPGWSGEAPAEPHDLNGQQVVGLGRSIEASPLRLERHGQQVNVKPEWFMAANDGTLVLEVAERCGYLAIVPDFLPPASWRPVLADWTSRHEVNAVTAPGRLSVPKIRYVIDCLKAKFSQQQAQEENLSGTEN